MGGFNLGISPDPLDSQPNTNRNGRLCEIKLWKTIVMIVRIRTSCSLSSNHLAGSMLRKLKSIKIYELQKYYITKYKNIDNVKVWFGFDYK